MQPDQLGDELEGPSIALADSWLDAARASEPASQRRRDRQLAALLEDPASLRFAMVFIDRVMRAPSPVVAARQLRDLIARSGAPAFLGPVDRLLLRAGGRMATWAPKVVMPLASRRMRTFTDHLVLPAEDPDLAQHLAARAREGVGANLNHLGEAILGEAEAERRLEDAIALLGRADVNYVSVKVSSIASQLNLWAFDDSVSRVSSKLRRLYRAALDSEPRGFVNLDMEEYRDLELTVDVFTSVLSEPDFGDLDAGIVLQAYVPDSFGHLRALLGWAAKRHADTGGRIKVRIVKGANLAMERVDSEIHGWSLAPYGSKLEVDANWKRMVDWALTPGQLAGARIGIASHNLFDVAWAYLLAERRGVSDRVEFEMLEGMAPYQAEAVRTTTGSMLLYTPIVAKHEYQSAIAYLFRRLEENAAPENFLRHLFDLSIDSEAHADQQQRFERSLRARWSIGDGPHRTQNRLTPVVGDDPTAPFSNEPDTDPALERNRQWIGAALADWRPPPHLPILERAADVDAAVRRASSAASEWAGRSAVERRDIVNRVGDVIARRRGEIVATMAHEADKVISEADPEVSEAIDFARYYARSGVDVHGHSGLVFRPHRVVTVVPPWNFPFAIPAGGVLAALAAGSAALLKPAPEVPLCGQLVVDSCHEAGVPEDLVQMLRCRDDAVAQRTITHPDVDTVILTGSFDTAVLFRSWRPDLALLAETSGKNAIVVSARADIDAAVRDLVRSAFGHSGQKCSAASLAIVEAEVYDHPQFRRQLADAVSALSVGSATDVRSDLAGLVISPAESDKLNRALCSLDDGEAWLVEPRCIPREDRPDALVGPDREIQPPGEATHPLWSPGVRLGVEPASWFHQTECFGPVLGVMRAADLDEALRWQNDVAFGLTAGFESLDSEQISWWADRVQAGNLYVNRATTGAIVNRQPFGGWKRSSVGSGAKAGGPNYVGQLGTWQDGDLAGIEAAPVSRMIENLIRAAEPWIPSTEVDWLRASTASDAYWWLNYFSIEHDPSGLDAESNIFRYRPLPLLIVRAPSVSSGRLTRVLLGAVCAGTSVEVSVPDAEHVGLLDALGVRHWVEPDDEFAVKVARRERGRQRHLGPVPDVVFEAAATTGVYVDTAEPVASGRVELLRYLREQSISRTMHRYGNFVQ